MKTRVRAVKDVRETVHDERVALVEEVDGHRQRVVPVAQTTNTRRSARTLYSQQGVTALDAHGAADAAAAAAGQLMASQAEEEAPVEGGTQEPLPDEAFPQVPDINASLVPAEEAGEGEQFGTPGTELFPTEPVDEGDEMRVAEAATAREAGPSEGRAASGQISTGKRGERATKAGRRTVAVLGPRTPAKAAKKVAAAKAAPAIAKPTKATPVKRGRPAAAAAAAAESEPIELPAEQEEHEEGPPSKSRKGARAPPPADAQVAGPPPKGGVRPAPAHKGVAAKAPPALKVSGKAAGRAPRHKKRVEKYSRYLHRVLKSVHPDLGISQRGMEVCESLINDMYERLVVEAVRLLRITGGKTLTAREVQTAVKLLIPGEMKTHAVFEGTKAVHRAAS